MTSRHLATLTFAALGWCGGPLWGQATPPDSTTSRRITGFVIARYVDDGTRSLYGAQRVGPVMLLGGPVRNTRTDVTTTVLGVGAMSRSRGSVRLSAFVAGARSSEGSSLRLYLLPSATLGPVAANATVAAYQPLGSGEGVAQAAVNPLTVALPVAPRVKSGLATIVDVAEGRLVRTSAGPYATVRVPGGALSVEWMTWRHHSRREVRWGFSGTY